LAVFAGLGCGQDKSDEASKSEAADFCEEHQIVESQCVWCDPSLVDAFGFCYGHGVPEAYCYRCNANLIPAFKAIGDWCTPHDRPESQCYICNPKLDPLREETPTEETSDTGGSSESLFAIKAASNENASRIKQPPSVTCSTQNLVVRFDNSEIAHQAGFEFAKVESRPISKTIECNAELSYDLNRYALVSTQVLGMVEKVHNDFGDRVEPGDALATIRSTHLGAAKASYLQAAAAAALWERNHAREKELLERGVSTEKDFLDTETRLVDSRIALSSAEQILLSYGLSKKMIEEVRLSDDTSALYSVLAPFSGIVLDRNATIGEVIEPTKPLFAVADISRMWALIDVYESNMREIQVGQPVVLQVEGLPGDSFGAHIDWISSQLDPQTRTLRARATLENKDGQLRANMFAQASISLRDRRQSLVVPKESVQWEGCCNVVFVKESETVFLPRKVHLGVATGTLYEVLSGIEEGEEVVTQGSFLLKTEILKGSIGAGCCEVDPGA
jgi:cobalt-zinc-cadmium efflux system membrane fusion protein